LDLAITVLVILLLLFWPRRASVRYYLLLIPAAVALLVALIFAPFLFLTPVFYVGLAILLVVLIYRALTADRKGSS
jgi:hypothetical protein